MGQETPSITVEVADPDRDDVAVCGLMTDYLVWGIAELERHYGIVEPPAEPEDIPATLAAYRPPGGVLLIARADDGQAAGVGALHRLASDTVELKRMFVALPYRSSHVGSAILDRLLLEARQLQATTVRLDTCRFMTDAQRMYRSRGFLEREPYGESEIPAHLQQHWMFFEKSLTPSE